MKYAFYTLLSFLFLATEALAQDPAANPAQPGATGAGGMFGNIVPLILIFAIFYLIMIRPQQKKLKQHQEMLKRLNKGDEVVTTGGVIGTVVRTDETAGIVEVEIADGVVVKLVRGMISDLRKKGPESERLEKAAAAEKADAAKKPAEKKTEEKKK